MGPQCLDAKELKYLIGDISVQVLLSERMDQADVIAGQPCHRRGRRGGCSRF